MTPAPAARQRVLIIDDEERIREVLVRILHRCDIDADAAADGAEAIGLVESRPYDLVILDLLMPGQHGFSVLTEITRRRPDQAVLVWRVCILAQTTTYPSHSTSLSWSPGCGHGYVQPAGRPRRC